MMPNRGIIEIKFSRQLIGVLWMRIECPKDRTRVGPPRELASTYQRTLSILEDIAW